MSMESPYAVTSNCILPLKRTANALGSPQKYPRTFPFAQGQGFVVYYVQMTICLKISFGVSDFKTLRKEGFDFADACARYDLAPDRVPVQGGRDRPHRADRRGADAVIPHGGQRKIAIGF